MQSETKLSVSPWPIWCVWMRDASYKRIKWLICRMLRNYVLVSVGRHGFPVFNLYLIESIFQTIQHDIVASTFNITILC